MRLRSLPALSAHEIRDAGACVAGQIDSRRQKETHVIEHRRALRYIEIKMLKQECF
jgi:hypothetical protein